MTTPLRPTRLKASSPFFAVFALFAALAWVAAALLLAAPVRAQTANDAALATAMDAAYEWLDKAGPDNTDAIVNANKQYEALLKSHAGHPLVMAYTGSSRALLAYTTMLPWKKIRHVEDGLALVDKSLALLGPEHDVVWPNGIPVPLETRFVAAKVYLDLPGFFNRGPRGETLLKECLADRRLAASPLVLRGEIWLQAAKLAADNKRYDEARRWAHLVVQNKAPQASAAQTLLKNL